MASRGFELDSTRRNKAFALKVRSKMVEHEVSRDKMMKLAGIKSATLSQRFFSEKVPPKPDKMTVRELRVYCRTLKLSDEDILDFVKG